MDADEFLQKTFIDEKLTTKLGLQTKDVAAILGVAIGKSKSGRHEEALQLYSIAVLLDPTEPIHQMALAECGLDLGKYDLAIHAASAVIALAPSDPRGYYLSGRACVGLERPSEALIDFDDAILYAEKRGDRTMQIEAMKMKKAISA